MSLLPCRPRLRRRHPLLRAAAAALLNLPAAALAASDAYYAFPLEMVEPGTAQLPRRSEATAVSLRDGNVLMLWCELAGRSDNAHGYIAGQELGPEGQPIGTPRVVFPAPSGGMNTLSPAMRRLKNGRIGVVFSYRMSPTRASREFSASADEGRSWSAPVAVSDGSDPYMTGCNDRLTVLDTGRLVAPLHCTSDWNKHYLHVKVAWSDDGGGRWTTTPKSLELPMVRWPDNRVPIESGCIEPAVAQRADGSLLMTIRTAMGTQFCSESLDRGETWTPPRSLGIVSPQAPAQLTRLPGTGDLLLLWTPGYNAEARNGGQRHIIMACVSRDGGRSWPLAARKVLLRDPRRSIDYPSILYRAGEAWITLRVSSGSGILEGRTGVGLMRVPISWFYR